MDEVGRGCQLLWPREVGALTLFAGDLKSGPRL